MWISEHGFAVDPIHHVVPGGANLDEKLLADLPAPPPPCLPNKDKPLRLGFLGKEWQRKGGPFVLAVADELRNRGVPAVVRAIGPDKKELPDHPFLQSLGFISKSSAMVDFVSELRSWHFGTLFSSTEAFGISNRECLRLGVPVLTHAIDGIPSTFTGAGCGQMFPVNSSAAEVAEWVIRQLYPFDRYLSLRLGLEARTNDFSWLASINQLHNILN